MAAFLKGRDPRSVQQAVEEHREMQAIREQAIKDGTFMKAPNGKPTLLNEHQWLQVRTKAFKDTLEEEEKNNIRKHLYTINRAGRTLLEKKDALYLLDHTDKEGLDNRGTRDGFGAILKADKAGLTAEDIQDIKYDIDNGNIRNQEDVNRWAEEHLDKQRYNDSDSVDAEDRRSNGNNDSLDYSTLQGESRREQSNQDSQGNRRESTIKTGYDGTNGPRYIDIERFTTPQGEVYGFVTREGKMYLDGKKISPELPIPRGVTVLSKKTAEGKKIRAYHAFFK